MKENRIILMYDMDMYFASVMIREDPSLAEKPLIVGALPHERGVVATASYEARKYGVKSGMSSYEAYKLCPNGVFKHPRMGVIIETSEKIKQVVKDYSDMIEFVALDEAYIDITNTKQLFHKGDLKKISKEIKERIFEATKCTCTIGIGYSKFSAKLASEENKPNGIGRIYDRKQFLDIITNESIRKIHGIGEQMEKRLNEFRIFKVRDLQMKSIEWMRDNFGVYGVFLHYMSWGIDDREIIVGFEEVGIGNSQTLRENVNGIAEIKKAIRYPLSMSVYRLAHKAMYCKNVMIKLRYGDFTTITRAKQLKHSINTLEELYRVVCELLDKKVDSYTNIRLVGVRLSDLTDIKSKQFSLFDNPQKWEKKNTIFKIGYELRKEFGYDVIKDTIGTELEKIKGDEKNGNNRGSFEIGNIGKNEFIERIYS